MEQKISQRIRKILNEIAIENQPKQTNSGIVYEKVVAIKLKRLAAELYLHLDYLANPDSAVAEIVLEEKATTTVKTNPIETADNVKTTTSVETPISKETVFVDIPPPIIDSLPTETPKIESVAEVPAAEIKKEEIAQTPVNESISKPLVDLSGEAKRDIMDEINFSQRFEFINNLFGRNGDAFNEFVKSINHCGNRSEAENLIAFYSESNNWAKRKEASDSLKKIIFSFF